MRAEKPRIEKKEYEMETEGGKALVAHMYQDLLLRSLQINVHNFDNFFGGLFYSLRMPT